MYLRNKDRQSIVEAYNAVYECECQHSDSQKNIANSSEERVDMILNNLVNLNNKSAELVKVMQTAIDSGESVEEWASEKIAVAASMIGSIMDYYAKFKTASSSGLKLQPLTVAANMPQVNNNMPAIELSI